MASSPLIHLALALRRYRSCYSTCQSWHRRQGAVRVVGGLERVGNPGETPSGASLFLAASFSCGSRLLLQGASDEPQCFRIIPSWLQDAMDKPVGVVGVKE